MRVLAPLSTLLAASAIAGLAFAQESPPAEAPPAAAAPASEAPKILKDHQQQLVSFQQRLDDIANKIAVIESKLELAKAPVFAGSGSATRTVIVHQNDLGDSFSLSSAQYELDGGTIFDKENTDGALDRQKRIELFNGPIPAGAHELRVSLVYKGSSFGSYTYLAGYKFKVDSRYTLNVLDGRTTALTVVTLEKPNVTEETKDRMMVRYDLEVSGVTPATGDASKTKP